MILKIDGKKVEFTLENEKTVSDVVMSIEQWITGSGHRICAISINGNTINASLLEDAFKIEIDSINTLEIKTSSIADLAAESLIKILDDINNFQTLKYEEKSKFLENWSQSPQAVFIQESIPDLYNIIISSLNGSGLNLNASFSITEERLREIKDPKAELEKVKPLLEETVTRLQNISLDLQTGKDARASQTVQFFSGVTEKILRVTSQLELQGLLPASVKADKKIPKIINDMSKLIDELATAYQKGDTVLLGDIAEYEASVKLQELYQELNSALEGAG